MMPSKAMLFLGFLALTSASGVAVSPVQKVLSLIDEFVGKVQSELDATVKDFEEFAQFCDKDNVEKGYALKTSQKNIESLEAAIADSSAKIDSASQHIAALSTKISETQSELDKAVALREKEHADFLAEEKVVENDIESIHAAMGAVGGASFAQMSPAVRQQVEALTNGLKEVAAAPFVLHGKKAQVAAFLQAQEDEEEGAQSDNVAADVMGKVLEMSEKSLKGLREKESKDALAHAMLKQGTEAEIKSMEEELGETTHAKQVSTEELAQATKDLAVEKKGHAEDTAYVASLKRDFLSKAEDFEIEAKDSAAELKALGEAKAILTKKFGASLLQTHALSAAKLATHAQGADKKARALRVISQLGHKLHSTALVSLAYRAAADPFGKVRSMIEEMLEKLKQEAAEGADKEAFCNEENAKSQKSKAEKEAALEKTNARMEKASSAVAELTAQASALSKELAEIDAAATEATKIRNAEKASFVPAEKDLSESAEACGAAIQVLREYYEGAALVQTGATVAVASKAAAQGGEGILGVLEFAEADFEKQLSDRRAAENLAADKYAELMNESKLLKATKEIEVKSKESEIKNLQTSLADFGEDKEGTTAELEAVEAYLAELKPKCETAVPSYAEVKARREQELAGLKEALKILA